VDHRVRTNSERVHRPAVRWIDSDTGEVKERHARGRDPVVWSVHSDNPGFHGEYEEWEMTALEMALAWVPDLETVIDRALMQGMSLEVRVKVVGK
jgi:predicted N-formylglutamate amidohydrolase